ncbi:MAG: class I SAM-dependent methyltransferase [Gemmatimonadota bacterium]|nr:class I SAM-dependent methyltransferase [Gemmatimonadota bacterium]MDH5758573.1 class I SAM-dependent methyltransferase [Gemmatimonadota bacterium]
MSHSVRSHLRVDTEAYDHAIRRFIPGYEEMITTAAGIAGAGEPALVLDLGAGTGALSAAVLGCTRTTVVELLDVDTEMLDQARTRLAPWGPRVRFTRRSFFDPLPSCDAVVASLSLHHIPTLEAKGALFSRIREALPRGGIFVNADVAIPAEEPERARAYRAWADHLVASGISEEDAWRHFEEWSGEDTYFPLPDEQRALAEAGFDARVEWRCEPATVQVGIRK